MASRIHNLLSKWFLKIMLGIILISNEITLGTALTCFCLGHCPHYPNDPSKNGTCEAKPGAKCFSAVEEVLDPKTGLLVPERTYGCLPPEETGWLQCKATLVPHLNPKSIGCCSDTDYCNAHLSPMYTSDSNEYSENGDSNNFLGLDVMTGYALLITCSLCLILVVIIISCFYSKFKKREEEQKKQFRQRPRDAEYALRYHPDRLQKLREQSSGSGSGMPLLIQKTIAKQIIIVQKIGEGRFGKVFLAKWNSDNVAVKVFFTNEEASWERETDIYQTILLRHENILGFIAADIRGTGYSAERLIITDYQPNGSLHDFLKENRIDSKTMIKMAYSIANGLNHLHTEIKGRCGKVALAHRDIKTKNILVKGDGSCCIGDFGLAVRYPSETGDVDMGPCEHKRVGTKRYMAPEVLSGTLNTNRFDDFKQADVYSFSLVLWELCLKTKTYKDKEEHFEQYVLPFSNFVSSDPSFEEMLDIVHTKDMRPELPSRWCGDCGEMGRLRSDHDEFLCYVTTLLQECWRQNPAARPNTFNIKKHLHAICEKSQEKSIISKSCKIEIPVHQTKRYATINSSSTIPLKHQYTLSS